MKINSKTPAEIIPVTFDFSNIISAIDSILSVSIAKITGEDASTMREGIAIISGAKVVQLIKNGDIDQTYRLNCLVSKGNEKYTIDGEMLVRAWH